MGAEKAAAAGLKNDPCGAFGGRFIGWFVVRGFAYPATGADPGWWYLGPILGLSCL